MVDAIFAMGACEKREYVRKVHAVSEVERGERKDVVRREAAKAATRCEQSTC
jgi:hypothetical protein